MALQSSKHAIGVLCCLIAFAACIVACIVARSRRREFPPGWPVLVSLTVLQLALLVDMLFSVRWLLHNKLASEFLVHHFYERRVGPQHLALFLVAAAASIGIWLLLEKPAEQERGAIGVLRNDSVDIHSVRGSDLSPLDGRLPPQLA